ncbi:hypothetical protein C2U71_07195 [Burkholderia ubonensis]|nr:hypothetical protein C2U71_07195 [Burkholderia ubonensis]
MVLGVAGYQARSGRFDGEHRAVLSTAEPMRQMASCGGRPIWKSLPHLGDRTEQQAELVAQRERSAIDRPGNVR